MLNAYKNASPYLPPKMSFFSPKYLFPLLLNKLKFVKIFGGTKDIFGGKKMPRLIDLLKRSITP